MASSAVVTAIMTCIINIFACIGAVLGNTVVLLAFSRTKELRLISNVFLLSLVCSDLLVGLIVDPLYFVRQVKALQGINDCDVWIAYLTIALFCTGASFLNLALISCERYVAIFHPFRYVRVLTVRRAIVIIASVWLSWILLTLLRFAGLANRAVYFICFAVIGTCYLTTSTIYFRIFREAKRHQNRINTEQQAGNKLVHANMRERKLAKTMAFIFGSLLLCYTPGMIILFIRSKTGDTSDIMYVYYPWAENLIFLNSALNPLIYCWRNREIRRAVFNVLKVKQDEVEQFSYGTDLRHGHCKASRTIESRNIGMAAQRVSCASSNHSQRITVPQVLD
jgi:hypothetical protein